MHFRKYSLPALLILFALPAFSQKGYDIKLHIAPLKDKKCYFGHYYGDQTTYLIDSAQIDDKSDVEFKKDDSIGGGIYVVVLPHKTYFEVVIDKSTKFSMETDTSDFIKTMKVKGSPENDIYYKYQNFIEKAEDSIMPLEATGHKLANNKDSVKIVEAEIKKINLSIANYRNNIITKYPQSFLAEVLTAMKEPDVPEAPRDSHGKLIDTFFAYHYIKAHMFDNINFADPRLLKTPLIAARVKTYLTNFTYQIPDSIITSVDFLLEKSKASKEMFKYLLSDLTHKYETSEIMGMDAVFVHLVQRYYLSGQADWVDKELLDKLRDRVNKITPNLLGKYAPILTMEDTSFRQQSLYDVKSKYTLVIFWKYDCGHCQAEIPKLVDEYNKKLKAMGLTVYAACTGDDTTDWKKFIRNDKMGDFINVFDPEMLSNYYNLYDVYSTPTVYLLDENKKIIAKRIDIDKIADFIDRQEKSKT